MAAAWLAQATRAVADTIVMVSAPSTGLKYWVETAVGVATIVIALALLALFAVLLPAAWNTRRLYGRINAALDRVQSDLQPVVRHAEAIAENVHFLTSALREDTQRVHLLLVEGQERLASATQRLEARLVELDALARVMQEEAERWFVWTAATLRGVQTGARTLRRSPSDRRTI
jgi:uncharacterized protein YoxC